MSDQPHSPSAKGIDLFGEVPITKSDVYAWLLVVVGLDPASARAAGYVRTYNVVQKITAAKKDGSFDSIAEKAASNARYAELVNANPTLATPENSAGVGEWISALRMPDKLLKKRAPNRPRAFIKKQRERERRERAARKAIDLSMLRRLPQSMPAFGLMLEDIGSPGPMRLAAAFKVDIRTAQRWIGQEKAPLAVMMAIFWITRWGVSMVDANAHNDAVMSATLASARGNEVTKLQAQIAHVERLADFGSANDPLPTVKARPLARKPADLPQIAHSDANPADALNPPLCKAA